MSNGNQKPALRTLVSNTAWLFSFGFRRAPVFMVLALIYPVFQQVMIFFEHIYSVKFFIDSIQYQRPFLPVLIYIGIMSGVVSFNLAFGAFFHQFFKPKAMEKIYALMRSEFYGKAADVDIECYDDPGYYNDFVWVLNRAPERFQKLLDQTCAIIGALAAIISSGIFVFMTDPIGIAFIIVSVAGTIISQGRLGKRAFTLDRECSPGRRVQNYVSRVYYTADCAKEIRLTRVADELDARFDAAKDEIEGSVRTHGPKLALFAFLSDFLFSNMALDFCYTLWVMYRVLVLKNLTYGDIVALFHSTGRMKDFLERTAELASEFTTAALFTEKVRSFLNRPRKIAAPVIPTPLPSGEWTISLEDVCFAYPGTEALILDHVSLTIPSGQSLALVGHNGAGKTSLVKLLMRLYDPTSGTISVNGIDIREFDPDEYRERVGVIFQDFQLFAASVGENVVMDRLDAMDGHAAAVTASLEQSGFASRLGGMSHGIATLLTREFDDAGENLSGGEAQKLAIARVVHKTAPLSILDEPSSALDPVSEYHLNETMDRAAEHSTVVYISHRLSTTRLAGRVCLLEHGRIIEEGTHDELMVLGGSYAKMFAMQAERYRPPEPVR
ncbi:MAG: ABC transporter ATP-binding protein [Spirochaetales bacterium]|nr:ABC transporter ATP-binding protein [Spirochaetales bacterium]